MSSLNRDKPTHLRGLIIDPIRMLIIGIFAYWMQHRLKAYCVISMFQLLRGLCLSDCCLKILGIFWGLTGHNAQQTSRLVPRHAPCPQNKSVRQTAFGRTAHACMGENEYIELMDWTIGKEWWRKVWSTQMSRRIILTAVPIALKWCGQMI